MIDKKKLTPEISEKYTVENNTFLATPKDNPKDLVQLELGDSKTLDKMLPQQKIMRWDNECNVSIRLKDFDNFTVETEGEKIKLLKPEKEVHFYQIEEGEGASEFEIILNEKPKTNVMEFSLVDKDVDYFPQPELEDSEIEGFEEMTVEELLTEKRKRRPENVVGSYAVYAKTPKTNWTGGKEYKCGKIGHIFRPKIIDSAGTEVWGDLHIENGILSVTIPQSFIDTAQYPIRHAAGLTWGYGGEGGSSSSGYNYFYGSLFTSPASIASTEGISLYGGGSSGYTFYGTLGIILKSNLNVITNGKLLKSDGSSGPAWQTITFVTKPTVSQSTEYVLGAGLYINVYMKYDAGGANQGYVDTTNSYNLNNPTDATTNTNKYSIYATYTAEEEDLNFVIADAASASSAENVALAQASGTFTIADSASASSAENITLVFDGGTFVIADSGSASSIENISLIFNGTFTIADAVSGSSAENIVLVLASGEFAIADSVSGSSADEISLIGDFIIADVVSTASAGDIVLIFGGSEFVIADSVSGSSAENITLAFEGTFEIADANSSASFDNIVLVQASGLFEISDVVSASSFDNISLVFNGTFSIDDLISNSESGNITLELSSGIFTIADALSTSTAENIVLTFNGGTFEIQDAVSESTAQNITLEVGYPVLPDEYKTIILADSGEIAIWIDKNVYIHAPPH